MESGFEIIDHTADVGIIAWGRDSAQAFASVAYALFSLIVEPEEVRDSRYREITINAPDAESLLVAWLNELIYLFDTENIIFKRFAITRITDTELITRAYGESVDTTRHRLKTGVKAATHHGLKIDHSGEGCRVRVLLDI